MLRSAHTLSPSSSSKSSAPAAGSGEKKMVGGGAPSGAKLLQILNVRVVGSGERVVVLSHGFGTDQSAWSRILPYLTREHRVVLYDLVCAGSVNPDHFDFRRYNGLDAYVDDRLAPEERTAFERTLHRFPRRRERLLLVRGLAARASTASAPPMSATLPLTSSAATSSSALPRYRL